MAFTEQGIQESAAAVDPVDPPGIQKVVLVVCLGKGSILLV
jgi:hypothetical protein